MKTTFKNVKIEPHTRLYAWENSDYTIKIHSRTASHAIVEGILRTKEPIRTDENGNEYIQFRSEFGRTQTYYGFAKDRW